jgi:hypothetical protein
VVDALGVQPSVVAVRAAHAAVHAAAERLTARLWDTATVTTAAALKYTSTDEASAAQITAVHDGLTEV